MKQLLYVPATGLALLGAYVGFDHHWIAAGALGVVGFRAVSKRMAQVKGK